MTSPTPPLAAPDAAAPIGTDQRHSPTLPDRGPELRSPSPKKPDASSTNLLGLGSPPPNQQPVVVQYPHLAHYIFNLLSSSLTSPPRAAPAHPLSVSSSGESDGSDEDQDATPREESEQAGLEQKTPKKSSTSQGPPTAADREGLVRKIVQLLDNEEEEQVKDILKPYMGELAKDGILMDQVCLDCMHRRKDDVEQVPYTPHYTPSRARASPSLNAPNRPFTPTRLPSFRARTPVARPQSPSVAGTQTPTAPHPTSGLARSESGLSPSVQSTGLPSSSGYSSSGSPAASPRMLNAKAATFNPTAASRVVSAPQSATPPSFSPSDPWKDVQADPPRSASPFGAVAPPVMARTSSNLAIAQPLFSDQSSPFHSPMGTPNRGTIKMPDAFASPSFSRTNSRGVVPDDDDDDDFNPFGSALPKPLRADDKSLHPNAKSFEPFEQGWSASSSFPQSESGQSYESYGSAGADNEGFNDDAGSGMTPLDVLASVFNTVPRSDLEDALHRSGYDFESAMANLVANHAHPRSGSTTPSRVASPRPLLNVAGPRAMGLGHAGPKEGYFQQGGRAFSGGLHSPGMNGTRSPGSGLRMCRYFLAGECRRSDCRFSHDLDRALCRFWLRGHCAKGPNCEFLHQLPSGFDPTALSHAMSRVELGNDGSAPRSPGGHYGGDEFPDLGGGRFGRPGGRFDPSRNRFANAVKRIAPVPTMPSVQITGSRQTPLSQGQYPSSIPEVNRTTPLAVPRPSARLKLRPPTLLPTVKTGTAANDQYMEARAVAIRLGHARNACLARAADAFRRGDGAAAKRFSREGKTLNEKMLQEGAEAASQLVKARKQEVQQAIRERDTTWSDDPADRSERGKDCGGQYGVIMGVASKRNVVGGEHLSSAERTECLVDLHTLHGTEGSDILGTFLAELEREHFRGLAYVLVGEEKHVGTQDPNRGASKVRLAASIRQSLAEWGYPWNETAGVFCVDACRI
ncbi:hypothetical protein DB88DRAFT_466843 [Papiliotrema laurentii]|uniref:C3H1-type domain-containing protein n=1 Tax=Papiliotrema laurentii TaxID=5418 RepID=A0AAD9FN19_PAPLA|nr:hypothetical protein DB88DRAFT_466843 [Papiliotrema laurentii]